MVLFSTPYHENLLSCITFQCSSSSRKGNKEFAHKNSPMVQFYRWWSHQNVAKRKTTENKYVSIIIITLTVFWNDRVYIGFEFWHLQTEAKKWMRDVETYSQTRQTHLSCKQQPCEWTNQRTQSIYVLQYHRPVINRTAYSSVFLFVYM